MPSSTATTTTLSQVVLTVYSKEIMFHAQPVLKYSQFATKKTELGIEPGLSIVFTKYNNLGKGGRLTEGTPMETKAMTATSATITVTEYGNAISVSEKLLTASFDDTLSNGAKLLGLDYAVVLDEMLRDSVMSTPNVYYANKKANRAALTADDKLNSASIKDAVQIMKEKLVRKYEGQYYIVFVTPKQARDLSDDSEFQAATEYAATYAGELGRIGGILFIETTQQPVVKQNDGDELPTVHQAVMVGDNAYGWAEALPVEMRDGGIVDFGRTHNLAWYSIMGSGIIEENNLLIIETK